MTAPTLPIAVQGVRCRSASCAARLVTAVRISCEMLAIAEVRSLRRPAMSFLISPKSAFSASTSTPKPSMERGVSLGKLVKSLSPFGKLRRGRGILRLQIFANVGYIASDRMTGERNALRLADLDQRHARVEEAEIGRDVERHQRDDVVAAAIEPDRHGHEPNEQRADALRDRAAKRMSGHIAGTIAELLLDGRQDAFGRIEKAGVAATELRNCD